MKIIVENMMGQLHELQVQPNDTIHHLKTLIQQKEGMNVNDQRLIFNKVELQNNQTIEQCKLKEGDKLVVEAQLIF